MTNTIVLYGIKACDTCRAARQTLEKSGHIVDFVDVRDTLVSREVLEAFHAQFGDGLLNKRSTTWRGLDESARLEPPIDLLSRYPTLMKRPVIEGKTRTLGWDDAAKAAHS